MPLTGEDVWDAIVRLGLMSGPYDPKSNHYSANADRIAALLNQKLAERESGWLPRLTQTEDAMARWERSTPREYILRLYKYLNQCGYSVIGIDAAIERESKKRRGSQR